MQYYVSFIGSVVTKHEFSKTEKLPVFKLKLNYCHESWVKIEEVLSEVQAAEMGFLRKFHGVTLHDKVRS